MVKLWRGVTTPPCRAANPGNECRYRKPSTRYRLVSNFATLKDQYCPSGVIVGTAYRRPETSSGAIVFHCALRPLASSRREI